MATAPDVSTRDQLQGPHGDSRMKCQQCPGEANLGLQASRAVLVGPLPLEDHEVLGPRGGSHISPAGAMLREAMGRHHPDLQIHQYARPAWDCLRHETLACKRLPGSALGVQTGEES